MNDEEEWKAFYDNELLAGRCPYSGEELSRDGEAGPHAMSCGVCDCFGFDPNDVGIQHE